MKKNLKDKIFLKKYPLYGIERIENIGNSPLMKIL